MKKYLFIFMALLAGAGTNAAYAQQKTESKSAQTAQKDPKTEQQEIKDKFAKLGKEIDQKLAVAEDNLKKASADTKEEMKKAVDKLKKEAQEVKKGSEKANQQLKEDWAGVKKELNDMADRIERDLKK